MVSDAGSPRGRVACLWGLCIRLERLWKLADAEEFFVSVFGFGAGPGGGEGGGGDGGGDGGPGGVFQGEGFLDFVGGALVGGPLELGAAICQAEAEDAGDFGAELFDDGEMVIDGAVFAEEFGVEAKAVDVGNERAHVGGGVEHGGVIQGAVTAPAGTACYYVNGAKVSLGSVHLLDVRAGVVGSAAAGIKLHGVAKVGGIAVVTAQEVGAFVNVAMAAEDEVDAIRF